MERVDCVVIGAGVVGIAIARALSLAGREVLLLDSENAFGTQTSARNSEVLHAGLSYAPGSLKARMCRRGRDAIYEYAVERGIGHKRVGKLIVATSESEVDGLHKYMKLAQANDVNDLQMLDAKGVRALEPEVQAVAGLFSPSTGIVDSHGLMLSYLGDAEAAGANLVLNSPVAGGKATDNGIELDIGGAEPIRLLARTVINSAGLYAHEVARAIEGMPKELVPEVYYAIGHYYTLQSRSPFTHLVYPVTREAALRVHVTLDLGGQCKFGPDIDWRSEVDYTFDASNAPRFYEGIRRFWPGLRDGTLQPGYTGIRPRLAGPESLHNAGTDFVIQGEQSHGVRGLVNLFGIESPGLTSSLAIGEFLAGMVA
ncbi:NAD(P)/FAD-dependent oxidoreductase [Cupriavidus sp. BIS7]|uniref:NAD(P)/FAD-dependent oxidoreductase n=1 Tax=Cupriavidus sp. BIS7 TaxID=1217718 RepID=UPI0002E739D5|nr:NAD(P)/FAD-dependent oxidoreductase [Cupriavidus sp. BIS7]